MVELRDDVDDVDVARRFTPLVAYLLRRGGISRISQISKDSPGLVCLTANACDCDYAGRRVVAELEAFFKGGNPREVTDEEWDAGVAAKAPLWELWARQDEEEARRWGDEENMAARHAICP